MSMLQLLAESDAGQMYMNNNEDAILEATDYFHSTPEYVKQFIYENLDQFVVPGDLNATYENVFEFTHSTVVQILENISESLMV